MKVAIGSDHAGWLLKRHITLFLKDRERDVIDVGTDSGSSVDYPDYARAVAIEVQAGRVDFGILICGTGLGMAITANKLTGIRAVTVSDPYCAELARSHNNANVVTFGGRIIGPGMAERIVETFLNTPFEGGRHANRIAKIRNIESGGCGQDPSM
ncbi:ribose 5-phosphate isomerase B [bacterium]|nr:ribose 5-phosphate isomerase B [candidate division CSSED10-310 bacterium]